MVPGFEFLQGLVKNAGAALPNMGQWVAPTLNPEELEKRIEELRTVQFWLEQNARMLGATIQALEVQRMTLSTLKTMNVQMGELRDAMKIPMPEMPMPRAPAAADEADEADEADAPQVHAAAPGRSRRKSAAAPGVPPAGAVDPMQWWGALTKQFTTLAATAMKDSATDAARNLAGSMVKQSFDAAGETLKKAVELGTQPVKMAGKVAATAAEGAKGAARAAAGARQAARPSTKPATKAPRRAAAPRKRS
ncbi:PhaM family polyhydroxyalkanoate granule multifunctional regulatory protein [Ideonella sp.]|uniref:PhaM family polyhydroxyalkanoate granule multifunctional regulatory protein n=1 Tax=Ideonella sp. TaxID=1929293 RepID=UPI0035B2EFEA